MCPNKSIMKKKKKQETLKCEQYNYDDVVEEALSALTCSFCKQTPSITHVAFSKYSRTLNRSKLPH